MPTFPSKLDINILGAEPHTLLLTPRYIPSSQHSALPQNNQEMFAELNQTVILQRKKKFTFGFQIGFVLTFEYGCS